MLVPVADLLGSPGATRSLHRTLAAQDVGDEPWGPAEDALTGDLELDLGLDGVVEGIYVHGTVRWPLTLPCDRCLRDVALDRSADVGELFLDPRRVEDEDELEDGYTLLLDEAAIDLERLLHDLVVLDMPMSVRCGRDDCTIPAGSSVTLLSEDEHRRTLEDAPDPRWGALADLDLHET